MQPKSISMLQTVADCRQLLKALRRLEDTAAVSDDEEDQRRADVALAISMLRDFDAGGGEGWHWMLQPRERLAQRALSALMLAPCVVRGDDAEAFVGPFVERHRPLVLEAVLGVGPGAVADDRRLAGPVARIVRERAARWLAKSPRDLDVLQALLMVVDGR